MSNRKLLYFSFIRYCLDEQAPVPENLSEMDWQGLFDFAYKQAILGIIYYGIQKLPKDAPRPDVDLELKWFAISEQIRKNNIALNMVCGKLTRDLLKDGFRSCILKGQGNALMYPDPYIRTSGDIDIWLDGTPEDIVAYARKRVPDAKAIYNHVEYNIIKDIEIELHYRPSFLYSFKYNHRLQEYIKDNQEPQFTNSVSLPADYGDIQIPTTAFNRVYQITHLAKHQLREGIGLRHLMDYYFLLKQGFTEEERQETMQELAHLNLSKFTAGMMYILKEIFHLEDSLLLTEPNIKTGKLMLEDIIKTGNFGKEDTRYDLKGNSSIGDYLIKLRRTFRYLREFPRQTLELPVFWFTYKLMGRF